MSEIHQLVQECLRGDDRSIVTLVDRYRQNVFALCFRILRQRQDAEDVAQETLVRMVRSLRTWDSARPFEPWLLTIAANRCRTFLSRHQHRKSVESALDHCPEPIVEHNEQRARLLAEEVDQALGKIRPEYRQAFVLFHEHELSYAEIAQVMVCPIGTVKTWVHRARKDLIQKLQKRHVLQGVRYAVR